MQRLLGKDRRAKDPDDTDANYKRTQNIVKRKRATRATKEVKGSFCQEEIRKKEGKSSRSIHIDPIH